VNYVHGLEQLQSAAKNTYLIPGCASYSGAKVDTRKTEFILTTFLADYRRKSLQKNFTA